LWFLIYLKVLRTEENTPKVCLWANFHISEVDNCNKVIGVAFTLLSICPPKLQDCPPWLNYHTLVLDSEKERLKTLTKEASNE
jgi:hypothetical protein